MVENIDGRAVRKYGEIFKYGSAGAWLQLGVWFVLFLANAWLINDATLNHVTWIYTYSIGFFPWFLFLRSSPLDFFQWIPVSRSVALDYLLLCSCSMLNWFINGCMISLSIRELKRELKLRREPIKDVKNSDGRRLIALRPTRKSVLLIFVGSCIFYLSVILSTLWVLFGIGDSAEPVEGLLLRSLLGAIGFIYQAVTFPSHLLGTFFNFNDYGIFSIIIYSLFNLLVFYSLLIKNRMRSWEER